MSSVLIRYGQHQLDVYQLPRVRTSIEQQSFAFYAATVWNGLSSALRDNSPPINAFMRPLKTSFWTVTDERYPEPLWRFCDI